MWRIGLLTVVALLIYDHKFHLECLLEKCVGVHLFLDGQLDLYSPGVRLCPDEGGVHEFDSLEAPDVLETQS